MRNWRTSILNMIRHSDDLVTLVLDPDNLLADQQLVRILKESQHDIHTYNNPVEFRYYYESHYRMKWENNTPVETKLIVRFLTHESSKIPPDLKERCYIIPITISDVFPTLNAFTLRQIGTAEFDRIFQGLDPIPGEQMNESETKKFLLESIYHYPISRISNRIDLYEQLFRIHHQKIVIPNFLVNYCIHNYKSLSNGQTIDESLFNYSAFIRLIQEEWASFLKALIRKESPEIPFDHPSLRVYVDTFFLEGLLTPLDFPDYQKLPPWTYCGIEIDPGKDTKRHFENLLKKIQGNMPQPDWTYEQWRHFAWVWAELSLISGKVPVQSAETLFHELQLCKEEVEQQFEHWLLQSFPNLGSLSYMPKPVMVHQIPHYINTRKHQKIALIVFDGLAIDQWMVIRDKLKKSYNLEEDSVYAWVPTLTSISRRAIFSGKPAYLLRENLQDYDSEIRYWEQLWSDYGFKRDEIGYRKGITLTKHDEICDLKNLFNKKVLGIVINTIDNYIKTSNITRNNINNLIERWADSGYLHEFFSELQEAGYEIYITSDHGNVNCIGTGQLFDGSISEEKSLRVRIYENRHLADIGKAKAPTTIHWPEEFIGSRFSALLSRGTSAFYNNGGICISHGSISLEEVIVPFIHLSGE